MIKWDGLALNLINVGKDELGNDNYNIEYEGLFYAKNDVILFLEEFEELLSWCQCKGTRYFEGKICGQCKKFYS